MSLSRAITKFARSRKARGFLFASGLRTESATLKHGSCFPISTGGPSGLPAPIARAFTRPIRSVFSIGRTRSARMNTNGS